MYKVTDLRLIGRGANSEVYLGIFHKKECVVKKAANSIAAITQLKNEAEVLKYLNGKGFENAPCYYGGVNGELIIEKIAGRTLDKAAIEKMTEEELNLLFIRITGIVAKLHELDPPVIHRDLKPQNIMMDKNGKIILIDFGTAEILSDYRRENAGKKEDAVRAGTKNYAAPEQYGGLLPESFTTDIYQLGKVMERIMDMRTVSIKYEIEIGSIIEKCCKANPLGRYKNVCEITGDLTRLHPSKKKRISGCIFFKRKAAYISDKCRENGVFFIDIVKTYDTIEFF